MMLFAAVHEPVVGTSLTSRNVRPESAKRTKADIRSPCSSSDLRVLGLHP